MERKTEKLNGKQWAVLFVILAVPFLSVVDSFILNVAIPSVQNTLHTDNASLQLVVAGYALSYASLLITGGRLGDIFGRKKVFTLGLTLFAVTSTLGAAAPNAIFLATARILQGASAAMMYPQALSLLHANFNGHSRTIALGTLGFTLGIAAVSAQLIGGTILQLNVFELSWRAIFLVNLPVSLSAVPLAIKLLPESKSPHSSRIDFLGVPLIIGALFALVLPLVIGRELNWPLWVLPSFAVFLAASITFILYEIKLDKNGGSPLLNPSLFKLKPFLFGLFVTVVFYTGQAPFYFVLTLYLQQGLGFSPITAALVFTPIAGGFFVASLCSPKIRSVFGKHILSLGLANLAISTIALSILVLISNPQDNVITLLPVFFLNGTGIGLVIPSLIGIILSYIPADHSGAASGVLLTTQQVAGAIGISVIGIIFFGLLRSNYSDYSLAFSYTIYYNIIVFITTVVLINLLKD
jgi:MFS family permease